MWYKLNECVGIILLIAVVGGGGVYGLYKFFTAPPLLRQSDQEVDPRQNPYTRDIMAQHDRTMRELQEQQSRAFQEAVEAGNSALGR
ncbi:MAG: hypothetical protein WD894_01680 [Pirellulales bacterium]